MQKLTARETQIAALIARGLRMKEIQQELGVEYRTLEAHRQNIYRKIGVHSAVGLCLWAIRKGIVSPPVVEDQDMEDAQELIASITKVVARLEKKRQDLIRLMGGIPA